MALTRKSLVAMGLESDKIDQIIEMHTETVNGLKEQLSAAQEEVAKYKPDAEKLPGIQKELDELKKTSESNAVKTAGDYQKLKDEYDKYKAEQEQKETKAAKEKVYRELLQDMKVSEKGIAQILKWQGVDSIELDQDGKIKDVKAVRDAVKADWSDYITTTDTKGANIPTPPANGGTKLSKKQIMEIKDTAERQKAIRENLDLFGGE